MVMVREVKPWLIMQKKVGESNDDFFLLLLKKFFDLKKNYNRLTIPGSI